MDKNDWWVAYANAIDDNDTRRASNILAEIVKLHLTDVFHTAKRISNDKEFMVQILQQQIKKGSGEWKINQ